MATRMEYPNASCYDEIEPNLTSYFDNSCPNMCDTLGHCEPFKTNGTRGHCLCPGKQLSITRCLKWCSISSARLHRVAERWQRN